MNTLQVRVAGAGTLGMQIGVNPATGMTVLLQDPTPGGLIAQANSFIRKGDRIVKIGNVPVLSFEAADVDGDGLVDKAELHAMMEKMGRHIDGAALDEMFQRFDADGSGKLDFDEFRTMMRVPVLDHVVARLGTEPRPFTIDFARGNDGDEDAAARERMTVTIPKAKKGEKLGLHLGLDVGKGATICLSAPDAGMSVARAAAAIGITLRKGDRLDAINGNRVLSFEAADKNGDGVISRSELALALRSLGTEPTPAVMAEMYSKFDTNGDGTMQFEEYCKIMAEHVLKHNIDKLLSSPRPFDIVFSRARAVTKRDTKGMREQSFEVVVANKGRLGLHLGVDGSTGRTVLLSNPAADCIVALANPMVRRGDEVKSVAGRAMLTFDQIGAFPFVVSASPSPPPPTPHLTPLRSLSPILHRRGWRRIDSTRRASCDAHQNKRPFCDTTRDLCKSARHYGEVRYRWKQCSGHEGIQNCRR